jgi:hypothetical protein
VDHAARQLLRRSSGKALLAALAAAMLGGCATPQPKMDEATGITTRKVTWVTVDDPNKACGNLIASRTLYTTYACADFRDPDNCIIYARVPQGAEDRQNMMHLGHEVLHCFVGDFHKP